MNTCKYIIFDLDGCISDDRARLPLIDHSKDEPWTEYHKSCHRDPVMNEEWVRAGKYLYEPIVFTARPEIVHQKTESWLKDVAGLKVKMLFMRPDDDHSPSVMLKERFLKQCLNCHGVKSDEIFMALDDREDILKMYRGYGLAARQLKYPEGVAV